MNFDTIIAQRPNKTIYRDGNRVIKLHNEDFSKADVLNEAPNQARIETTGLNIPRVLEVTTFDGKWAIVSDYIPGKTLAECMEEQPEKEDEYLEFFVRLQMQVHAASCPMLNHLTDKMQRKISQTKLDATTRYELHTRLAGMQRHNKVCHGDFNPSNIILRVGDGVPFILDWSHVTQGNASADVARTYLLFYLQGRPELADRYLRLFCGLSDTPRQYVQQWMPIVAASQSVKGKPEELELLYAWANVAEYQ